MLTSDLGQEGPRWGFSEAKRAALCTSAACTLLAASAFACVTAAAIGVGNFAEGIDQSAGSKSVAGLPVRA